LSDIIALMRQVLIYRDPESDAWIAEVPSLPGCVSDGPTREAALANVREAIEDWIDAAREIGREIPPDRSPMEVCEVGEG